MLLESQVCSLELSKKLLTLGVNRSSLFFHTSGGVISRLEALPILDSNYSAFTVAELLNMLPGRITLQNDEPMNSFLLSLQKSFFIEDMDKPEGMRLTEIYIANYVCDAIDLNSIFPPLRLFPHNYSDPNAANALARILIEIIENKFIEIKK